MPKSKTLTPAAPLKQEEQYRLLFEKNPLPMWVYDQETLRFLAVNEAAVHHFGFSQDEFLDKTVLDIRPPEDAKRFLSFRAEITKWVGKQETYAAGIWRLRKKDGGVIEADITSSPIRFLGRKAMLVLAHDVTERRRAEERIRFQADMLAQVHDAVLAIDLNGLISSWNDGAARMYGYSSAEAIGRPPAQLLHDRWLDDPTVLAALHATGSWFGELNHVTKQGQRLVVEAAVSWFRKINNQRAGILAIIRDITPRRKAEEALRASEQEHRVIAELTSDYAYQCRVDPNGDIVMVSVTEGFTRITGYTFDEIVTLGGWVKLIHPDDMSQVMSRMPELLGGEQGVQELRIVTKSGEARWIRYSTLPMWHEAERRVTRLLGAVQDITESKQAEEKLQDYAQRLQALSRRLLEVQEQERRHLARELHDEIGQVVTGLRLSLEMCSRLRGEEAERRLQQADGLLQDLTMRIRDLSLRLRPTMLDDLGLIPALLWHFERYTAQTRIQVAFEHGGVERRFPAPVETAAYRIVQEGLTNVARHADTQLVTVRLWLDQDVLNVQIEDQGHGFDVAALDDTGHSSGLSGMYERAVLLGGRFELESCPGAGVRLTAELPIGQALPNPGDKHASEAASRG